MGWQGRVPLPEAPPEALELVRAADRMLAKLDAYRREARTRFFEDLIKAGEDYRRIRKRPG